MCGILGIIAARGRFTQAQVKDALDTIAHRGPDDQGILRCDSSEALDVWLGHRRLAVLDLSPAGHQPMYISMPQQRQGAIVFNGEIYNYTDLLRDLMAQTDWRPRSRSDTEVLLAGLLLNGGEFLRQTNGMLALACVDQQRNVLILARDRLGKKPSIFTKVKVF